MSMESAREAQGKGRAGSPTGFRRLTPSLLRADRTAKAFDGLPDGVTVPGQVLAAFKAAAPRLGLSPRLVHAVDWLFRFTQPQDWGRGGRPIVWPSALMQQETLGLSESRVKAINRALIEAGVITMKDSPNGKRYGVRDRGGRIIEAYGFDLSPLAIRYLEFVRLAEEARAERAEMGRLRRRATIARKGITQILETVAEYGFPGEEWTILERETRSLARALSKVETPAELALGVESLERRQRAARERLENLLAAVTAGPSEVVNSIPSGPENRLHQYTYKPAVNPKTDTVIAQEECSSPAGGAVPQGVVPELSAGSRMAKQAKPVRAEGTVLRLSTEELVRLAPRLRPYLATPMPDWPAVVDAADWLRSELGVSKTLWGEACLAMGREEAAIAVGIVSAKPAGHFRSSPGGYFSRDGGQGEGWGAQSGPDDLGVARSRPANRERSIAYPGAVDGGIGKGVIMDEFTCESVPGGAEVRFSFDRERLAAFRYLFPDARWRKDKGVWFIPEPEAADRANRWIDERQRQERAADEAAARAGKNNGIEHPRVSRAPQGWAVRTPHDPALTELLRGLPGARWNADLKRWTVPLRATEALRAALPRLTELAAEAESRAGAKARQAHRARSPLIR